MYLYVQKPVPLASPWEKTPIWSEFWSRIWSSAKGREECRQISTQISSSGDAANPAAQQESCSPAILSVLALKDEMLKATLHETMQTVKDV